MTTINCKIPCIAGTWDFSSIALRKARIVLLEQKGTALDAVESGIRDVEEDEQDQYFVGIGGLPNADCIMEFDAAIMDHKGNYGAVMCLQDIRFPISVARSIMENCPHNILAGSGALKWALSNGFTKEDVLTSYSKKEWEEWLATQNRNKTPESHDTIGLICMDSEGRLAAGTSTSGWKFKLPGRVGDSPVVGSGLYCDGAVGAAVATGDGEEILRTCLSFLVVELMRQGYTPGKACSIGIERLKSLVPPSDGTASMHGSSLVVGVVAMNAEGTVGAASTLGPENLHRGNPYFPVKCWRPAPDEILGSGAIRSKSSDQEFDFATLQGTEAGNDF